MQLPQFVSLREFSTDAFMAIEVGCACFVMNLAKSKKYICRIPKTAMCVGFDGKEVPYEEMDGGFFVPAHPAFQEDHAINYYKGNHPLQGCAIKVVEQPGKTEIYLDSKVCKR